MLLILFILMGCNSKPESHSVFPLIEQVDSSVFDSLSDELQSEHNAGTFDGLVLVTKNNAVLFKSAFGYANRNMSIKNGSGTISDIGSIAKTFTAAAILQLAQKQKINLSDSLGVFYPNAPEKIKSITISQLLSHSSGLDNFHNDSDFEPMNKTEAESRILSMPLISRPGEKIVYSNAAYTLLAAIIEKVSDQPFQVYIHHNLLEPLSLNETGFYQDANISANIVARGYGGDDQGRTTFERDLTWALIGAGGMVSSIDDLSVWFTALRSGAIFPANAPNLVLKEANKRWMLGSLALRDINGESVIQMGGSTDYGFTALIQFVPKQDLTIVLLLNAYGSKYGSATHHYLSRKHILPILLSAEKQLPNNSIQSTADASAD
jgi:CubicO group peptidase (beta-lactamase class C family)